MIINTLRTYIITIQDSTFDFKINMYIIFEGDIGKTLFRGQEVNVF